MAILTHSWDSLRGWWQTATAPTRALATGMVLLMVVGLVVAGSLATSPDYQPIYHGVSGKDAAAMETVLHGHAIDMHYDDKEQTVSVPSKDGSNATMYIAAAGILSQDSVADGTETEDVPISPMDSPDVVTQKQNTAKEVAMDRKLMRLDPIAAAAVSISAGTATTLFGNDTAPTASVILTLKPGQTLSSLQVKGVINLVAHAVTGLTPDNVTLTDQSGMPLGQTDDTGDPGLPGGEDARASELARKGIQDLLDRTVGLHKAIVTVHAELNLDQTSTDSIMHTPLTGTKTGLPVSVRTKEEDYSGGGAGAPPVGGVSGSASNLNVPSYNTSGAAGGSGKYANTDTTTNYDNDVTHTLTKVAPGSIKKETVTALVDTSVPADTVAKLKDSISTAIGATPGDTTRFVTVQQFAFDTSAQKAEAAQMQSLASQQLYSNIARALAVAVVAIVLLVLLTRSGRRTNSQPQLALAGGGANVGHLDEVIDDDLAALLDRSGSRSGSSNHVIEDRPLTVEDVLAEMPEPEARPRRRPRVQSIEEQQDMKMESIRTMVDAHPESVALLLKGWMAEDMKVSA
ncbi:MAG: flagellar M-ring protein FliF C-terminal domain-containing protein [Janthinobacterium lividum]